MADISSRNLATSMRMMAWERAKGELRGILHTYWPSYYSDGKEVDEGFNSVNDKVQQFIQDLDDLLIRPAHKRNTLMEQQHGPTVQRTERGWAGHFCGANRCRFRRNTLLECGDTRIVVSTVGLLENIKGDGFTPIGFDRHFETMAFHAAFNGRYWDADVSREISFDSPWMISEIDADDRANDQHEAVVSEISARLTDEHTP